MGELGPERLSIQTKRGRVVGSLAPRTDARSDYYIREDLVCALVKSAFHELADEAEQWTNWKAEFADWSKSKTKAKLDELIDSKFKAEVTTL